MPARRVPEVLSPAGDLAALRAAVRSGADAVYFGLPGWNARARATNFDVDGLPATLRELHAHGVRGYVTLNTLVFDDELPALEEAIRACAAAGVDAVIVQDLGVARLVRAIAPGLALHASTQMTCTDAAGVSLARDLGARRVVLARELSLEDIAAIRAATDVDLEVFVHGALCIAYSGQCLTSEAIGGRSANRGACAQACRLPYELVVDDVVRDLGDRAYLLSPEDLEASARVPELVALGVSALKIEGRLKDREYVAATTALYRRAVDAAIGCAPAPPGERDRVTALQTYSRGSGPGFLDGVDHQRLVDGRTCDHRGIEVGRSRGVRRTQDRTWIAVHAGAPIARGDGILVEGGWAGYGEVGGRVWAIREGGRETDRAGAGSEALLWLGPDKSLASAQAEAGRRVFKTSNPEGERAIAVRLEREAHRVPIDVRIHGAIGEPFVLSARSDRGHVAQVTGDAPVERSRSPQKTGDAVREKIARLGDTPFVLRELSVDLPPDAMVPVSAVNRARRALVEALESSLHAEPSRATGAARPTSASDLLAAAVPGLRPPPAPGLFVLCRSEGQARAAAAAGADGVILDFLELTGTGAALRAMRAEHPRLHVSLAPPRIRKPGEDKIDRFLRDLRPDALLVRSLGGLAEAASGDVPRIGDFSLNVTNRLAAADVLGRGLSAFTPSFDLDAVQLSALCAAPFGAFAEVVVHHPMPLFHMEHCVFAALLSDGQDFRTCGRPCERHHLGLRDRAGMIHPIEADVGCRNTVFHAAPQSAIDV
ncbi:MAG: U32 family peptidase, partial [Polyangiaceae bacterium]|nr:U32 family peptidase [Polyangiaceae bacterium]